MDNFEMNDSGLVYRLQRKVEELERRLNGIEKSAAEEAVSSRPAQSLAERLAAVRENNQRVRDAIAAIPAMRNAAGADWPMPK